MISDELFEAVLALDSYDRGYDPSLPGSPSDVVGTWTRAQPFRRTLTDPMSRSFREG
jgi:hypothetical protein